MTTTEMALIVFGFMTLVFMIGLVVGAIISGGLDDKIKKKDKKKDR